MEKTEIVAVLRSRRRKQKTYRCFSLGDFLDIDSNGKKRLIENFDGAEIIVKASVGGLSQAGLLDEASDFAVAADADADADSESNGWGDLGFKVKVVSSGSESPFLEDLPKGAEIYVFRLEDAEDKENPARIEIATKTTQDSRAISPHPQLLDEHQRETEECARRIANTLHILPEYEEVLALAARLHDEGKRARRWQKAFSAPVHEEAVYAKTKGPVHVKLLDGYRHEFGSLCGIEHQKRSALQGIPAELQDLVLHLITAHHGFARPFIEISGCEDAPPSLLEDRAREVVLRFARLQKRWGPWGLAWWEALVRSADQQASQANDQRGKTNA